LNSEHFGGGVTGVIGLWLKFILLYLLERYDKIRQEKERNRVKGVVGLFIKTIHN